MALLNPPSANRALPVRLFLAFLWLTSGVAAVMASALLPPAARVVPLILWAAPVVGLLCLQVLVAVNEREQWSPRVARTIPESWWLRLPAFVFYSGAAGGIVYAVVMLGPTMTVVRAWTVLFPPPPPGPFPAPPGPLAVLFEVLSAAIFYTLAYALSAVLVRRATPIPRQYTWVVALVLAALGSVLPFVLIFLVFLGRWRYQTDLHWLVTNPVAAMVAIGENHPSRGIFLSFAALWALAAAALNLPWFIRQFRAFRPYVGTGRRLLREGPYSDGALAPTKTAEV